MDPGQIVRVGAKFNGDPERVLFSYLPPGSNVAVHDPGFGKPGSRLERLVPTVYRYVIDTRKMQGGLGWWHFSSEDDKNPVTLQRAKLGKFVVRDAPAALFDHEPKMPIIAGAPIPLPVEQPRVASGYSLLGASVEPLSPRGKKWMWWLLGIKAAVTVAVLASS